MRILVCCSENMLVALDHLRGWVRSTFRGGIQPIHFIRCSLPAPVTWQKFKVVIMYMALTQYIVPNVPLKKP